ncbi:MlaE family ABC transporter permease [Chitinophaga niabensis]|uniref:Phospholipid/cholesterol/gamma-HCH transport system permease protein n=1 Tax=Chitinophaga niabensis TaxID=536979 RepID=A0A1N6DKP6_9BACT|nr:ABC transporter permease [Chitinophaga niabensis]SIN71401.1 phospholipid/cholesterol/gamma-HCH transport system permease protein [Chitinophaga niabensis]
MEPKEQPDKPFITKSADAFFISVYDIFRFIARFFREAFRRPWEVKEFMHQCYMIGYKSLALISLTGFITGLVFTKQSRPSLAEFGATSWLPSLISIAVIRALAPLVTALICAGKVGSSIGAELASMKVTEQVDAMEVSAINPFKYLVVTRVLATTACIPLLMCYTAVVGLAGSYLDVHLNEQTSLIAFIQKAFVNISFLDLGASLFKSIVFGFTIGIVSAYQGYNASQGTQGVGKAANVSVVISMFLIFIEEIVIVQVVNSIR